MKQQAEQGSGVREGAAVLPFRRPLPAPKTIRPEVSKVFAYLDCAKDPTTLGALAERGMQRAKEACDRDDLQDAANCLALAGFAIMTLLGIPRGELMAADYALHRPDPPRIAATLLQHIAAGTDYLGHGMVGEGHQRHLRHYLLVSLDERSFDALCQVSGEDDEEEYCT